MTEPTGLVTSIARLWIDEGIVCSELLKGAVATEQSVTDWFAALRALARGRRFAVCNDMRNLHGIDRSARMLALDTAAAENFLAVAHVVGPPISEMIVSFLMGDRDQPYPRRVFTDVGDAVGWLRQFATEEPADAAVP